LVNHQVPPGLSSDAVLVVMITRFVSI